MKLAILCAFVVLCCLGCRNDPQEGFRTYYQKIPIVGKAESSDPFPGQVSTPEDVIHRLQHATKLADAFPLQRFVKLEAAESSILREITRVTHIEGHWVILDAQENQVFLFGDDGSFVRRIGRPGEGPGEYIGAQQICKVWGELIGVVDGIRGRLLVFDIHGDLIRETARIGGDTVAGMFPIVGPVIWHTPERLYLSEFGIAPGAPQHVALDYSTEEGALLFGFGERCKSRESWAFAHQLPKTSFISFIEVQGRIWSPNPHGSHIEIFDGHGHLLGKVNHPHPDNLTYEDYHDIKPSYDNIVDLHTHRQSNKQLIHFRDVVVQLVSSTRTYLFNVYDRNGALLAGNLTASHEATIRGGSDLFLVGVLDLPDKQEWVEKNLLDREYEQLLGSGFRPDNFEEDNPYLMLWGYPSEGE